MSAKTDGRKAFFTVPEIAERWQQSERQVHRVIASGALPAHRFGRSVRVAVSDLLLYEATCRGGAF